MPILIGADVGGSKTAVGVSEGGDILVRADGPGAAVRPGRALASAGMIAEVVRRALAGVGRLTGRRAPRRRGRRGPGSGAQRAGQGAPRWRTSPMTWWSRPTSSWRSRARSRADPGIVVSAGTGSIAVGRDASGTHRRIGGYGWQMGDEGSGYAIGRAALGAVSRAHDGRSPRTALSDRVLAATRSADFDSLVRWAASASPSELAALAPHVLEVAAEGDPLAQGIADYAARELSQLAICLRPAPRGRAAGRRGPHRRTAGRGPAAPSQRPGAAGRAAGSAAHRCAGGCGAGRAAAGGEVSQSVKRKA